ncbi:MAG: hypothetical protein R3297_05230 [Desulfobulbales bacterium]|nr:hypothetical protein [Desulfobulbales bacterium]
MGDPVRPEDITDAQTAWGDAIVAIGKIFSAKGDYVKAAERYLDSLYAFASGPVLFKPTKAADKQFRPTREAVLSYFVGGNETYREDHGFAIHPWIKVRFENNATYIHGDYAVAMGNYFFTQVDGSEIKVEYTFGYIKGPDGRLKINLHHSSIPFKS